MDTKIVTRTGSINLHIEFEHGQKYVRVDDLVKAINAALVVLTGSEIDIQVNGCIFGVCNKESVNL